MTSSLQPARRRPADRKFDSAKPDSGLMVSNAMYAKRYGDQMYFEIAERFAAYAQEAERIPSP